MVHPVKTRDRKGAEELEEVGFCQTGEHRYLLYNEVTNGHGLSHQTSDFRAARELAIRTNRILVDYIPSLIASHSDTFLVSH